MHLCFLPIPTSQRRFHQAPLCKVRADPAVGHGKMVQSLAGAPQLTGTPAPPHSPQCVLPGQWGVPQGYRAEW